MRRAALRSALTVKAAEASIVVLDELKVSDSKTSVMVRALYGLVGDASTLILIPEKLAYESVIRSARNLPETKILLASYLNIRDLLKYEKIILPLSALDVMVANLG